MSKINLRLKELRKEKHLKQDEMADIMKVSLRQYRRYETGEFEPNLAGWLFLADFYNVSLDYLVGRSGDRTFHP